MEKNWLIRTKSCHILGPVSREKVIELLQNGSIKPEDEICSGNGFWIWLREKDMVDRYLLGNEKQSFNPISEAPDVCGEIANTSNPPVFSEDITLLTNRPSLEAFRNQETQQTHSSSTMAKVADRTAQMLNNNKTGDGVIRHPNANESQTPKPTTAPPAPKIVKKDYTPSPPPVTPGRQLPKRRSSDEPRPVTVLRPRGLVSDRVFLIGALVALFALAVIFFYRKQIITQFAQNAISVLIPTAYAQADDSKKKIFFPKS